MRNAVRFYRVRLDQSSHAQRVPVGASDGTPIAPVPLPCRLDARRTSIG